MDIFETLFQPHHLTIIGLIISIAFLGSKIFQRFGSPQVVGFIVFGVILGPSFLHLVPLELSQELTFISQIALGLIGFDMGSHLRFDELSKLGRGIAFILSFEALGTFLLVSAGIYLITGSLYTALLFGALSSATAPAATVDVLAEYEAKGPLTTTLLAVVGLDDALALMLFCVSASVAESLMASSTAAPALLEVVRLPLVEIGGAILIGLVMALILNFILHNMKSHHDAMAMSIGMVLVCVGLSQSLGVSLILTTMVLGMTIVNRSPENGRYIRFTIEQAGPVIYVLFFALVGARFQISLLPTMGLIGIVYIILRSAGKFTGAWIGGKLGNAPEIVTNNLGFGLLSQAGVAIGLALECERRFVAYGDAGEALGSLVISVITATTFVVQIIGPIFVKLAITRAGEIGMAKSKDDIWASEGTPR